MYRYDTLDEVLSTPLYERASSTYFFGPQNEHRVVFNDFGAPILLSVDGDDIVIPPGSVLVKVS